MCSASCFSGYDPEARSRPRISAFANSSASIRSAESSPAGSPVQRVFLMWLNRWFDWHGALTVVTPRTFVGWHRQGFRAYWRRKCQAGRPPIPLELQHLIRRMARENPSWREERIANELLLKLGLRVSPRTVQKYWPKVPAAPADNPRRDQRWSTFLKNHAAAIIACDFCVVASATFGCLRIGGHGTRVAPNYSP
jgi:putative transposase